MRFRHSVHLTCHPVLTSNRTGARADRAKSGTGAVSRMKQREKKFDDSDIKAEMDEGVEFLATMLAQSGDPSEVAVGPERNVSVWLFLTVLSYEFILGNSLLFTRK